MEQRVKTRHILKKLLAFTVPLILSGLLQQVFNWVDAFIVGNVIGETALAGVGVTTSVYNLFITVVIGFTSGLSVLSAQQYGRGEKEKIKTTLGVYTRVLGILFAVLSVLGMAFVDEILRWMDTPATLYADAKSYMSILFLGVPFLAVYNTYSAVLRGMGNSRLPFAAVLVSSAVNVALDLLFVAAMGCGTAGAAAATALSQAAMTVFIVLYSTVKYPVLRFSVFRQEKSNALVQGGKYGLPPAIQSGVGSLGSVFLQKFMNGFGEQTVAAITTAYRVDSVLLLPIANLGTGIATLVAQNIGAGDKTLAKRTFRLGLAVMTVISLLLTGAILTFGEGLVAMFGLTAESVETGVRFFRAIAVFYIVYGLSMAIRGYLEGTSDMLFSGIAGILSLGVRILCSYAFVQIFDNMVVAYAEAFSWVFLLAVFALRYREKTKDIRK